MQAFDFVLGGRRSDGSLNGVARGDGGLAGGFLPVVFAARVDDGAAGVDHHAGAFGGLAGLNAGADVAALSADPRHEQGKVRRDAAHVGEFGGIGGADDEAEFAVEVPLGGGKARKALDVLTDVVVLLCGLFMLYTGGARTMKLFSMPGTLPITGISTAWQYLPIPVAGFVMSFDSILFLTGIISRDDLLYSEKEIDYTDVAALKEMEKKEDEHQ